MSTITTSIQHYNEGPSHCTTARKQDRHKGWKEVKHYSQMM